MATWGCGGTGGGIAGLSRKRPSRLDFTCRLNGENAGATGKTSRGSGWRNGGRRGAHSDGVRPWSFGEESRVVTPGLQRA
jgi:hypothetical protein